MRDSVHKIVSQVNATCFLVQLRGNTHLTLAVECQHTRAIQSYSAVGVYMSAHMSYTAVGVYMSTHATGYQ